jgi:hypothetical protein
MNSCNARAPQPRRGPTTTASQRSNYGDMNKEQRSTEESSKRCFHTTLLTISLIYGLERCSSTSLVENIAPKRY